VFLVSRFYDNFFVEDAVASVGVGVDAGDVKMTLNKGHHHLHLLENYYYL
jgi:hypothetical protein